MRTVVLFIAMSVDGYIADQSGGVDWLMGEQAGQDDMQSYHEFIKDVDSVVMGWNTYYQIANELSLDEWYYKGLKSYIITHRKETNKEDILFINENPITFIQQLKQQDGNHIWICGGAHLVQQLLKEDVIDRFHISIIPTLLGNGIRLFDDEYEGKKLKLVHTTSYNGIVDIVYEKR